MVLFSIVQVHVLFHTALIIFNLVIRAALHSLILSPKSLSHGWSLSLSWLATTVTLRLACALLCIHIFIPEHTGDIRALLGSSGPFDVTQECTRFHILSVSHHSFPPLRLAWYTPSKLLGMISQQSECSCDNMFFIKMLIPFWDICIHFVLRKYWKLYSALLIISEAFRYCILKKTVIPYVFLLLICVYTCYH